MLDLAQIAAVFANVTADQVLFALCWIYAVLAAYRYAEATVDRDQHYRDHQPDWPPHPRLAELEWTKSA